ncbi:unnamed protein product [Protopolystoma xenopodis]|uniref:C2 domain-containing protein n=1 Tax=Protopolystoma xenopodis TaxID=117903 RepID=A0A3S5A383_9PLAT|nr:unnamed protein product [Protopolystoma xenopodis]
MWDTHMVQGRQIPYDPQNSPADYPLRTVPFAEVAGKTLVFAVYDFDRFSKHDQIGQIQVPLGSVDLARVIEEWRDLSPPDDDEKVSCSSSPTDNNLHTTNLLHYRRTGNSDLI